MSDTTTTVRYEVSGWGPGGADRGVFCVWDTEAREFVLNTAGEISKGSREKMEALAARREAKDES